MRGTPHPSPPPQGGREQSELAAPVARSNEQEPPDRSLQLQSDHAQQAVRHRLEAFEPGGLREQELAVIEVEDRLIRLLLAHQGLVNRLALGHVGHEPRILKRLVGRGIAPGAVVQRRA